MATSTRIQIPEKSLSDVWQAWINQANEIAIKFINQTSQKVIKTLTESKPTAEETNTSKSESKSGKNYLIYIIAGIALIYFISK